VQDRARVASPLEMQAIYDRNRSRLGGQTFEQVRPHIERSLREQAQAEREAAFHRELRARAEVKVALVQPRVQVAVPDDAPTLGPAQARVTVVEFLDYQCPYCHRAQEVVDQVLQRYEGKVRFVHRDYLIGQPRSLPAARAARCAGEQGRFWEYHRSLLTAPGDMSDADLGGRAAALGLEAARFSGCLASDRHDAAIRKAAEAGQALGITGTPTFFVNGRRLVGVRPFEEFEELIEAELKS
jgi:protein-disulfide isomerase